MKVVYDKYHVVNRTVNTLSWTRKFTGWWIGSCQGYKIMLYS